MALQRPCWNWLRFGVVCKSTAIALFSILCLSNLSIGQVSIRERVGINPQGNKGHSASLSDLGATLSTPVAGQIAVNGSGAPCSDAKYEVLIPVDVVNCGGSGTTLPGNWKAGTNVNAKLVIYPGYPYQQEYYCSEVAPDPYGDPNHFLMKFPGWDDAWALGVWITPGPDFDHFLVKPARDTVGYGDTTQITVTAVDHGSQEVSFDGNTQLTFSLDNGQYGSFLSPSGALVSSPLSGVIYSDARAARVKFVASKSLTDSLVTAHVQVVKATDPSKTGTGAVVIRDPFSLQIVFPPAGQTIDSLISAIPSMPLLYAKTQVKGRLNSQVTYNWMFTLRWDHHVRKTTALFPLIDTLQGTMIVSNADTCRWAFPWGAKTRGGWLDTLSVSAICRGRSYTQKLPNPFRIRGTNPSPATVRSGQAVEMQVILYKESSFRQFLSDNTPLWNNSAGYGLAQIDPPFDNQQYWNWVVNRLGGNQVYAEKQTLASTYVRQVRRSHRYAPDLTPDQMLHEVFQRYNKGTYWRWVGNPKDPNDPGHWEAHPATSYGDDAFNMRQNVLAGNPPWNQ